MSASSGTTGIHRSEAVSAIPGIGEKRAHQLRGMGIATVEDLLSHFPRDYDDRSQIKTVAQLLPGAVNTIRGFIAAEPENVSFAPKNARAESKPLVMTKARLRDHTGELELIWFNQPYLKKYFLSKQEYVFTGKVTFNYNRLQMESPDYEKINGEAMLSAGCIVPLYTTVGSISQKVFRGFIRSGLKSVEGGWPDDLPYALRQTFRLCERQTAIHNIHFPENDAMFLAARRRLVFEELFFMQSALFKMKGAASGETGIAFKDIDYTAFTNNLPFPLTGAQQRTLADISADMQNGFRMNRLIQGDVGSGKTAVAMAASFLAIKNGYQAAIMAPTEVLAEQHFAQFSRFFNGFGYRTVLLTGSLSSKTRTAALAAIREGTARMIVGTHALIQASVAYWRLGLVITDEQHRFGVNQRLTLIEKGDGLAPHTLVMTATPIPRTLGLILYGDMDVSIIDEMPPGRRPVKTYCVGSDYRKRIHAFIRKEVEQGRQAYVICPAIEEREQEASGSYDDIKQTLFHMKDGPVTASKADLQYATQYTNLLSEALPGIGVACLHGRMKPAEKQSVMDDFKANRIQVIVSTTVIEVGVHVANASLMVIENADRFGLSQLHQLRGRVGRGGAQSYCVLITDTKNEQTKTRMKAMTQTTDGFTLSEMDLQLRGTGDFFGVRQHGLPSFAIANLYRDMEILQEAQTAAQEVFKGITKLSPEDRVRYDRRIKKVFDATRGTTPL